MACGWPRVTTPEQLQAERRQAYANDTRWYYTYRIQRLPDSLIEAACTYYIKPSEWQKLIGKYFNGKASEAEVLAAFQAAKKEAQGNAEAAIELTAMNYSVDSTELARRVKDNLSLEDFLDCLYANHGEDDLDKWTIEYGKLCRLIAADMR